MDWYLDVLKNKYALFDGRARRKEYWTFTLINIAALIVLVIFSSILGAIDSSLALIGSLLMLLYSLATLVPGIAVTVRRLHDTDRPWFWILVALVPLVGGIILLVFMIQEGTPGDNQFGKNPKGISA